MSKAPTPAAPNPATPAPAATPPKPAPPAPLAPKPEPVLKLTITPDKIKDLAVFFRDELGFDHISAVSGVDWIAKNEFEVVYFVGSVSRPGFEDFVVALSERVPRDRPNVPTLIDVWTGADYHERETHEMFGIVFDGHPSTAHLLLPEDWNDLPPLRKDYVSPGR